MVFWDQAVETVESGQLDKRNFTMSQISKDTFISDLKKLKSYFNDHKVDTDIFLLNWKQMEKGKIALNTFEERLKQSIGNIHHIARMLTRLEPFRGFKKFINQLNSDRGYLSQLYATFYIEKFLKIRDIEVIENGQDIDIVAEIEDEEFYIHVKAIHQAEKMTDQFKAHNQITLLMWDDPVKNSENHPLQLKKFSGAVPKNLDPEYFKKNLNPLPTEPCVKTFSIPVKNGKPYVISLHFDWDKDGRGSLDGIDHFRNFPYHLQNIEARIAGGGPKNIILGVTIAGDNEIQKLKFHQPAIEALKIDGLIYLSPAQGQTTMHFVRSEVCCKDVNIAFKTALSNKLASKIDL